VDGRRSEVLSTGHLGRPELDVISVSELAAALPRVEWALAALR